MSNKETVTAGMRRVLVVADVHNERDRQDAKWGEQNHVALEWVSILGEEMGEVCKAANEAYFGGTSYDDYRAELVQVAAVAVAAIECLDRKAVGNE